MQCTVLRVYSEHSWPNRCHTDTLVPAGQQDTCLVQYPHLIRVTSCSLTVMEGLPSDQTPGPFKTPYCSKYLSMFSPLSQEAAWQPGMTV